MIENITIEGYKCVFIHCEGSNTLTYMIYPELVPMKEKWLTEMAKIHNVSIAVIYIPAEKWNNVLTPWPEPGEVPGFPPFAGHASEFLNILKENIIPEIEKGLSSPDKIQRDLIGVSLSGLFTLWQWINTDIFRNIASLSGSFWYNGFIKWLETQKLSLKPGKAYFLLGDEEPKAHIKAYRSVGVATETVVMLLKNEGINAWLEWVPGNHFAQPVFRAEKAFQNLYPKD